MLFNLYFLSKQFFFSIFYHKKSKVSTTIAAGNKLKELHLIKFELFKSQDPENGRFDVIFEINGKKLYAHKNMLNLVSDTFDTLLSDRWNSKNDEPIQIKYYSYENFYQFITFLYSGECQLTDNNICTMTDIAEFYNVSLFKTFCDEYLSNISLTLENVFQFLDLANKYSMIQLKRSVNTFITLNFLSFANSETFLKFDKSVVKELIIAHKDAVKAEDLFQVVYKWAEKQAGEKQNQNDAIKFEISDFLPHINFSKMEHYFVLQFVVSRSFIFGSVDELTNILCKSFTNQKKEVKVKVTNFHGQTLYGNLIPDNTVIENVKLVASNRWNTKCQIPSIPSLLKVREDVEWYLIYNNYGYVDVTRRLDLSAEHYLLAEMMPENGKKFHDAASCKIEIV